MGQVYRAKGVGQVGERHSAVPEQDPGGLIENGAFFTDSREVELSVKETRSHLCEYDYDRLGLYLGVSEDDVSGGEPYRFDERCARLSM